MTETSRCRIERQLESATRHLEGYLLMLNIAHERGMEYEEERIMQSIREWAAESDHLRAQLESATVR